MSPLLLLLSENLYSALSLKKIPNALRALCQYVVMAGAVLGVNDFCLPDPLAPLSDILNTPLELGSNIFTDSSQHVNIGCKGNLSAIQ